jgi:hypothetical protein
MQYRDCTCVSAPPRSWIGRHVRSSSLADAQISDSRGSFWGQSGHHQLKPPRQLLTQSGRSVSNATPDCFTRPRVAAIGLTTDIISIDTTPVEVADPRVSFVQSDCIAWLAATAAEKRDFARPCLVIEDFHGDLGGVFRSLDVILAAGDYLVIEDSYPKQSSVKRTSRFYPV